MFDIGWSELLVIGIVALVVIGPKDLPKVLRGLGGMMSKVRSMASEFQGQFQEAMRDAELAELKKQAENLAASANNVIQNPVQSIESELQKPADTASHTPSAEASPPQAEPLKIEPAPIAPDSATSAESSMANDPARKQGSGA